MRFSFNFVICMLSFVFRFSAVALLMMINFIFEMDDYYYYLLSLKDLKV